MSLRLRHRGIPSRKQRINTREHGMRHLRLHVGDCVLRVAAAGYGSAGAYLEQSMTSELSMIDVNGRAVAQLAKQFGSRFVQRQRAGWYCSVRFLGVPAFP